MRNKDIIQEIERYAPPALQEKWDNTGLQVGTLDIECTGVLICFDVTPEIVEEAFDKDCNLIISHHPLFFKPIKKLTFDSVPQTCAIKAISHCISIYSSHTAMDSTVGGISYLLAKKIGIAPDRVLAPLNEKMILLRIVIPADHVATVSSALHAIGAGAIGDYDYCNYMTEGKGSFRPLHGANPYIGEAGNITHVDEVAVDMVLDASLMHKAEQVIKDVHPYETPAYMFIPMLNSRDDIGLGILGTCYSELTVDQLLARIKQELGATSLRISRYDFDPDEKISRVAVCGGSGGEFIPTAIALGAKVYISGDIRYHDFVDYGKKILIVDAGHYNTEYFFKHAVKNELCNKFPTFDNIHITTVDDNPIKYV